MKKIELYDYIELKDGRKGHVVKSWDKGKFFDIELDEEYGTEDDDRMDIISCSQIKQVICKSCKK